MPSRSKYTQDELLKAVQLAKSGTESVRKIATKYGIPRTTLRRAISRMWRCNLVDRLFSLKNLYLNSD